MMAKDEILLKKSKSSDTVRFTVLDFLILVLVTVCVVGIFFRGKISSYFLSATASDKIAVGFVVEKVDKSVADSVKEDDSLYVGGDFFASVESAYSENSNFVGTEDENGDGVIDTFVSSYEYDIYGKLIVSGRYTDNGFLADGNMYLTVGKMLEINGPGYTLNVIITEIPRK